MQVWKHRKAHEDNSTIDDLINSLQDIKELTCGDVFLSEPITVILLENDSTGENQVEISDM